jgi:unsaturated chondroitin disaccharide hydrolase
MYRESGLVRMRDRAMEIADAFLVDLPADSVPYWDFDAPDIPSAPRDSSSAAIAASGLVELSSLVSDAADRVRYRGAARAILSSLMSSAYLSDGVESAGLLLHGTGNKPSESEVDVTPIYGDYYFVESLMRYKALPPQPVPVGGPLTRAILGLALAITAACVLGMRRSAFRNPTSP